MIVLICVGPSFELLICVSVFVVCVFLLAGAFCLSCWFLFGITKSFLCVLRALFIFVVLMLWFN